MFEGLTVFNKQNEVVFSYPHKSPLSSHMKLITKSDLPAIYALSSSEVLYKIGLNNLNFVTILSSKIPPAAVETVINQFYLAVKCYFQQEVTDELLKSNRATVLRLYSEMLDTGVPRFSEPDILNQLVQQPSHLQFLLAKSGSASAVGAAREGHSALPQQLNPDRNMPDNLVSWPVSWRKALVKHHKEEIFVDVIEKVRYMSTTSKSEVQGSINLISNLSGLPTIKINMSNTSKLQFPRVHKAVTLNSGSHSNTLQLIPPDGLSQIMEYKSTFNAHHLVQASLTKSISTSDSHFEFTISTAIDTKVSAVDHLVVVLHFPANTHKVTEISSTSGDLNTSNPLKCVYTFTEPVPTGWRASLKASAIAEDKTSVMPLFAELNYSHTNHHPSNVHVDSINVQFDQININPANLQSLPQVFKGVKYTTQVTQIIS